MKAIFTNKNFMLLWVGLTVSRFGIRFIDLVIMWYVIQETGSALALGATVICITLPTLLFGPIAGVMADRYDKKKIMVIMDFCNGAFMFILSALLITGNLSMLLLYILVICMSIVSAFFNPASSASIPLLIEERYLTQANSLNQFSTQGSNIIGPAAAGILLAVFNNEYGLLLIAGGIAFIISAITEIWIKVPSASDGEQVDTEFIQELKEGLQFILEDKRLLMLIISGGLIINFFLAPLSVYFTIMSDSIFNVGSAGLGMLNSSLAIGALIGSLMIMFNLYKDKYKTAIAGLVMEGVGLVLIGSFMDYYVTIAAVFIIGMGTCFASIGLTTLYQTIVPKQKMGRVLSIVTVLLTISIPLGTLFGSMIISYIPMFAILLAFGIIVTLSGLSVFIIAKQDNTAIEKEAVSS
ncbi:MFS transporter [Gracilibacillus salitolerans]|uniref:MFS transporter n=1 Tax=Gracilibacillus salitolerans TaxID=2663022 RepID=A0A5Q2TNQ3_9BACI|nr:MFS transporter [Gracilibacillus salitolerans]QGH34718.1 MFS transporter [Gracilibacillus salitolerans]